MKQAAQQLKKLPVFLLICFLFYLPLSLAAGDVKIGGYRLSPFATLQSNYEASVDYSNDEDFDVHNFKVNFSVFKLTPSLSWELEYEYETDLPYGTVEIDVSWDNKGKAEADLDLKPIPENEKPLLDIVREPDNPMSMEELKILHTKEEEENKKKHQHQQ